MFVVNMFRKIVAAFGEVTLILSPMFRQGPTGIYVLVDDEVVRNFVDEGHFIVQLVRGKDTYQVILK